MANEADKNKTPFSKGVKAEYKKIIWPTRKAAVRQTAVVIVVAILMGLLIAMLDTAIKFGLGFIL